MTYLLKVNVGWLLIKFLFAFFGLLNSREHSKKFNPDDMQATISGKNCIVTGANSGIGYATAEGLASRC